MKVGLRTVRGGFTELGGQPDYNIEYVFNNRRPVSLQYVLFPHVERTTLLNLAAARRVQPVQREFRHRGEHALQPDHNVPASERHSGRPFLQVRHAGRVLTPEHLRSTTEETKETVITQRNGASGDTRYKPVHLRCSVSRCKTVCLRLLHFLGASPGRRNRAGISL